MSRIRAIFAPMTTTGGITIRYRVRARVQH